MEEKPFHFKQFSIHQDKTAMKVGTDGVLLGAWSNIDESVNSILDIGSGTGLIALMMAQRSFAEVIDAVEIEDAAYVQCVENFERSDWADRLFCYHTTFQEYSIEMDEKYDLIISNPPFYNSTYKDLNKERALARHSESLSYEELLTGISKLLSDNGSCAFIIPYSVEDFFIKIAIKKNLVLNKRTRVRGNENSKIKRSLLQFSFREIEVENEELIIEKERHLYTNEYKRLVKNFYLKM